MVRLFSLERSARASRSTTRVAWYERAVPRGRSGRGLLAGLVPFGVPDLVETSARRRSRSTAALEDARRAGPPALDYGDDRRLRGRRAEEVRTERARFDRRGRWRAPRGGGGLAHDALERPPGPCRREGLGLGKVAQPARLALTRHPGLGAAVRRDEVLAARRAPRLAAFAAAVEAARNEAPGVNLMTESNRPDNRRPRGAQPGKDSSGRSSTPTSRPDGAPHVATRFRPSRTATPHRHAKVDLPQLRGGSRVRPATCNLRSTTRTREGGRGVRRVDRGGRPLARLRVATVLFYASTT